MAIDLSTLTDYAWADIAKAAKAAMVNAALGGNTLSINGRTIGRISIDEASKLYDLATQQAAADANNTGGMNVLVQFGEAQ
jgi:hypothetical protein